MPAQSPTLSPTLSAITAGLRGSSSGMPASTLPTRSAPTSAALVKMPPPSRAKTQIRKAPPAERREAGDRGPPEAEPDERVYRVLLLHAGRQQDPVVAGHAEQREARDEQAGDGAALEGAVERRRYAAGGRLGHARIHPVRHVHSDEAGGGREGATDEEADRGADVESDREHDRQDHGDAADDRVLALQVGAGALLD